MRALVLLYLALLRSGAPKLCDTEELCSCDHTWDRFNCSCTAAESKELILSPSVVPDSTVNLRIENCSRVHILPNVWVNHRGVRRVEFLNIKELVIESSAFSWNETFALEPVPQSGLVVSIVNCSIPEIPSYTFKGRLTGITLHTVTIGTIRAFAFASLYRTEKLELIECVVQNFEAQAFKKFSLENLHIIGGHFNGSVPSRTWVDLEVYNELLIERVIIGTVHSSSFIIYGPRIFHLHGNHFVNMEGEAFRIRMRGKTVIRNNIFDTLAKGAFVGISVEDFTLKTKGIQVLQFENNTISHFENGYLLFNVTSFKPQVDSIIMNHTCSCTLLETWGAELNFYSSQGQYNSQQQRDTSSRFWCRKHISEETAGSFINLNDFSQDCILTSGLQMFLIIILTSSLVLLSLILLLILLWRRYRSRNQKRWINIPTTSDNDSKKKKTDKNSKVQKKSEHSQDSRLVIIVPDGHTYRETELNVIVEQTEPIVGHEYVDTAIDEHVTENQQ